MRPVPWHVKGVRPEVREAARDAARRCGLSVGAWLNALIIDAAADGYRESAPADRAARFRPADDALYATIRKEIEELKRQISRPQVEPALFEQRLQNIEARINTLQSATHSDDVDEAIRRHLAEFRDNLNDVPPVEEIAKIWRQDLVEISATLQEAMPTSVIAELEGQVRTLAERLEERRGGDAATEAITDVELALIGIRERLQTLTPAEDLAELSHAVRLLSSKADLIAAQSTAPEKIQQLEQAIGALQGLVSQVASRDVVAALSQDIKALGDKIDRNGRPAFDSEFMNTLERRLTEIAQAVTRCRPLEGASVPANFEAVITALADRLEAMRIQAADQGALKSLEQRIDTLVDKLENSETSPGRRGGADCRMDELLAQLRELRAQNESRLEAIQHQIVASAADAISGPAESIRRDVASLKEIQTSVDRRTQDTFEAVYGTIEQVVDRLASIEDELRDGRHVSQAEGSAAKPERAGASVAVTPQFPSAMLAEAPTLVPSPTPVPERAAAVFAEDGRVGGGPIGISSDHPSAAARLRHPAVPDPACDAPIEPGSGARRVRVVANAIDRIAASEAASGGVKPTETAGPLRANFVAAARRAAQAVVKEREERPKDRPEKSGRNSRKNFPAGRLFGALRPRIRSMVLGLGVIIFTLGALRVALDILHNPEGPELAQPVTRTDDAAQPGVSIPAEPLPLDQASSRKGANLESVTSPVPVNADPVLDGAAPRQTPGLDILPDLATPAPIPPPVIVPTPALRDAAASLPVRNALQPGAASRDQASRSAASSAAPDLTERPLPATIGGRTLIAAATAGDPGASYEIAIRFAQGRNAPQDFAMAAAWFERAAQSGLAPAQFRLGSMYEKGLGVKKDLAEARRLYVAAADKGNAKAMHNLAVLYAEGLDGKPDYAVASQWFRRAALHGIVDSQYNLAILYARGVGVERNLAESYKWFALAAKGGDKDAAKKRDEIATRLDPKQLESAKLNAESFVAEPQPDEATSIRSPAGGWDQVVAAATTKPRTAR